MQLLSQMKIKVAIYKSKRTNITPKNVTDAAKVTNRIPSFALQADKE